MTCVDMQVSIDHQVRIGLTIICEDLLVLQRCRSSRLSPSVSSFLEWSQSTTESLLLGSIAYNTWVICWEMILIKLLQEFRLTIFDSYSHTAAAFQCLIHDILQRGRYHCVEQDFVEGLVAYGLIKSSQEIDFEAKPMFGPRGDCAFQNAICNFVSAQS